MKKVCIALLLVSLLLPFAALAGEEEVGGPEAALKLLDQVFAATTLAEKHALIMKASQRAPEDAGILMACARLLSYLDEDKLYTDQCEAFLRDAVALSSGSQKSVALQTLAELLLDDDRAEEATALLEQALLETPGETYLQTMLVMTYFFAGMRDEALAMLTDFLEDTPDDFDMLQLYGAILLDEYRFGEAEAAYKRLDERFPDYLDGLLGLYQTYVAAGAFDQAARTADKLILSGGANDLWLSRARLRVWMQRDPEAGLEEAEALLKSEPGWIDAAVVKLSACLMLEREEGVREAIDAVRGQDSNFADVLQGVAWMNEGRFPEAEALFQEVLHRAPDYAPAWSNLAAARLDGFGDIQSALNAVGQGFYYGGDAVELYIRAGQAYRLQGDLLEAARAFAAADLAAEEDPFALYMLTFTCFDAGRAEDTMEMLALLEKTYPGWYETLLARVFVEDALGNGEEALAAFEALKAKFPFPAASLVGLEGALRASLGQPEGPEMIKAAIDAQETPLFQDWIDYSDALARIGDLAAAQEALETAATLMPEEEEGRAEELRLAWFSLEAGWADLYMRGGDIDQCVAALGRAAKWGWQPAGLQMYGEYGEVCASEAFQALLAQYPPQDGPWDFSVPPAIPPGGEDGR